MPLSGNEITTSGTDLSSIITVKNNVINGFTKNAFIKCKPKEEGTPFSVAVTF